MLGKENKVCMFFILHVTTLHFRLSPLTAAKINEAICVFVSFDINFCTLLLDSLIVM